MKFIFGTEQYKTPPPFNYYKYVGSFTAPPCDENVIWFVASEPIPLGSSVLEFVRDALNPVKKIGGNKEDKTQVINFDGSNRVVQPISNREVMYFDKMNSCEPYVEKKTDVKMQGHFEKVEKKVNKYFYVDSDKPSGIPQAFVISKKESEEMVPLATISDLRTTDRYGIH